MVRRLLWSAGILTGVVVVALAVHVARTWDRVYDAPLQEVPLSTDPAVLARGEYLAYGPAHCVDCHASADAMEKLALGMKVPLSGGLRFPLGPLGAVYAANLTPDPETGIGRYSDAHVARMMRWAVKPDGRATIEPMMPYGNMGEDDLVAVISYLRVQPPVRNSVPTNEWTIMGKVVKSFVSIAKPRRTIDPPRTAPPEGATRERGEYLARNVANCVGCHTPRNPVTFVETGPEFSGGYEMEPAQRPGVDSTVWFRTPNITPSPGGGLLKFPDRDTFIARFQKGGRHYAGSPMPWEAYARMTTEDIASLYEFLHSLPSEEGPMGESMFKKAD